MSKKTGQRPEHLLASLSGANRASSLRDPVTAIPRGTLGAIIFSYFMYMSLMVLWASVGNREYLKTKKLKMGHLLKSV